MSRGMEHDMEAMIERAERELHDSYWDADAESDAETTRRERHDLWLESLADRDYESEQIMDCEREEARR